MGLLLKGAGVRVTRPVVQMQAIARRMSEGHFDVRAPVRSVDEIGALGRALNVMLARLREKMGDLEQERARSDAVLEGMVEGVIAVDGRESIIRMNERVRKMEEEMERLRAELQSYRDRVLPAVSVRDID